jgi:S-formylglutathione hydrolase FrmB
MGPSGDAPSPQDRVSDAPDRASSAHRLITRRRVLIGGAAVVAAGVVAERELPLRRWYDDLTHACGDPGPIPPRSDAALTYGSFESAVLGSGVGYGLAVPPGHVLGDPLPVVCMLPGRGGVARANLTGTHMPDFVAEGIAERGVTPFALASVDGGDSYWHRRADGEDRMAMLIEEFLPMLASRWHLGEDTPRAVTGWSMGGYGALLAAQQHPDLFVATAAASPAIWRSYEEMESAVGDAFDSSDDFAANDLFAHHDALERVAVRIDCGTADPFFANDRALADTLRPRPAGEFFAGCHDSGSWRVVAPAQVDFLGAALAAAWDAHPATPATG